MSGSEQVPAERRRIPAIRNVARVNSLVDQVFGLATQALTSHVSNLLNKAAFHEIPDLPDEAPLVIFVDLAGFKAVNDGFGHLVGDAMLLEVGTRLSAAAESMAGVAYHLSGDEFAVVFGRSEKSDSELMEWVAAGLGTVEVPVKGRVAPAKVELFFGYAPRDTVQVLAVQLKRAERAADEAKDLRKPWIEWTEEMGREEIVSWRRKCGDCGATTALQVRQSKIAEPQAGNCANCGAKLPVVAEG